MIVRYEINNIYITCWTYIFQREEGTCKRLCGGDTAVKVVAKVWKEGGGEGGYSFTCCGVQQNNYQPVYFLRRDYRHLGQA